MIVLAAIKNKFKQIRCISLTLWLNYNHRQVNNTRIQQKSLKSFVRNNWLYRIYNRILCIYNLCATLPTIYDILTYICM